MIFYLQINSNDVLCTQINTFLISSPHSTKNTGPHGICVHPDAMRRSISYYIARSLIKSNWIDSSNLFLTPNED